MKKPVAKDEVFVYTHIRVIDYDADSKILYTGSYIVGSCDLYRPISVHQAPI